MNQNKTGHTFHIPVMGTGYTVDTPVKVAHYGISSVISIVDDMLIEKMREAYCKKLKIPFHPISTKNKDCRAERITSYLNLVDKMVKEKFEELKNSVHEKKEHILKYIEMLPDFSRLKKEFNHLLESNNYIRDAKKWVHDNLSAGAIDVNVMTKVDKANYFEGEKLPDEYNDAHAALRGFANSTLQSSLVLSAGMNPKLYSYIENFEDFYPNEKGLLKKKITLKVSDYRSALIQGKFLAKKGLWVSEFRIESGLNCGGHAFATDGYLMGPVLDELKNNRELLISTLHELYEQALKAKNRFCPPMPLTVKITAQGGVGTADEHRFLLEHYQLDSIGWGTPFLLVAEATNVDEKTKKLLCDAKEDDLYLSNISPMGVPFNSLRNNTKDVEKLELIQQGKPGSPCPKKLLQLNELDGKAICTASQKYQDIKIKELDAANHELEEYINKFDKIVDKACLCLGLGASALMENNLDGKMDKHVSICPGPNMAYFSKPVSLKEMIDHIYGRINIIERKDRPNMFIKELMLYIDYLKNKISETQKPISPKEMKNLRTFHENLNEGIKYYKKLFAEKLEHLKTELTAELELLEIKLNGLMLVEV